jgi:hypothetical protein
MKVNRPGSPFGASTDPVEPLDPREAQGVAKGDRFREILSQLDATAGGGAAGAQDASSATRGALAEVAQDANLSDPEAAEAAVRQSAGKILRLKLDEKYQDTAEGEHLINELADYVAADPFLKSRLISILSQLKAG